MFASGTGSMRGPRVKTPLLLLLLLLLLTALTKTVLCDDEDPPADEPGTTEAGVGEPVEAVVAEDLGADGVGDGHTEISEIPTTIIDFSSALPPDPSITNDNVESPIEEEYGSGYNSLPAPNDVLADTTEGPVFTGPSATTPGKEEGLSLIIILIPVVLVVLIIGMIVCGIFINRRWNEKARNQELRKEDPYLDGSSTEKVPMPMFEEDVPSVLELEMEELDQWMQKDGETAKDSTLA